MATGNGDKPPDNALVHPGDSVGVEPVSTPAASPPGATAMPALAALAEEVPEPLTEEDLAAREAVAFPLDMGTELPGPPVGSEVLLAHEPVAPPVSAPPPIAPEVTFAPPSPDGPEDREENDGGPEADGDLDAYQPGQLTMEAVEDLTEQDLLARASVGFPLDLEPVLPGPAVGSETVLLETDMEAARRLRVRGAVFEDSPPPSSGDPLASLTLDPPPAPFTAAAEPDAPPASSSEPLAGLTLDPPPAPWTAAGPDVPTADLAPALPVKPVLPLGGTDAPTADLPPAAPPPVTPVTYSLPHSGAAGLPLLAGQRQYAAAWAWAALGPAPVLGRQRRDPPRGPRPQQGGAGADELLDLAAVGEGPDGVTEMLLVFKDQVWAGVTCRLRMEPAGVRAVFVAPDDAARRAVNGMADELLARLRRRGLRVGGYTVEVGR